MDIKDVTGIPRIQAGQARKGSEAARGPMSRAQDRDEVSISPEARRNAGTGRLEELKHLVKSGLYKPDIRQIALNLINDELAPLL